MRREALFLAGLEVSVMHLGLWLLSWPVRLGLIRSLVRLAPALCAAAGPISWFGSYRGGMLVGAEGLDAGGVASACARASSPPRTADLCRPLGRCFDGLPAAVRAVHGASGRSAGRAVARTGRSLVARALCRTLGLPASGRTSAAVEIARVGDGETWTRRFSTGTFRSRLAPNRHLSLFERDLRSAAPALQPSLDADRRGLAASRMAPRAAPLPLALAPRILVRSEARGAAYGSSVVVAHRWLGLVLAYRGSLESGGFKAELRRPPS